jgi:hypothetical protein
MGEITNELRSLFFRVVRGMEPRYMQWVTPVYAKEMAAV